MLRTLIVGLGRAGAGLHLPVLRRLRREIGRPFADTPPLAVDPAPTACPDPDQVELLPSLAAARDRLDPRHTVVHICTPPRHRAGLVEELAGLGFRKLIIEKPLAAHPADLAALAEVVHRERLDVSVVAPWLASTLTDRLVQLVREGELGELRRIAVRQHKPRFRRSLITHGHPTAFDIEIPHALGVALLLGGDAEVTAAHWHDLRVGSEVRPMLGGARLELAHRGGARTEIVSDLTSPVRERRITLRFARGTATGHFPGSSDDEYAQLRLTGRRLNSREVFPDDALGSYLTRAYRRFLLGPLPPEAEFDGHVRAVRLLSEAKRLSGADLLLNRESSTERELSCVH
ncbi:Gfo/Idh/MocA family oxidoreductase [Kitasatospora sp. NBC_01287]|uniref:Gfo/Idh/MocA family oxidoreductase n=1 Tax=Kitasatospora sp. NBC_01287 TaxID=2903573 RepID=UPI002250F4B1|nr:Gfo/Idh/MocA family oxidoreductase [Kitasatospora sp. NBC_01287]MCX4747951.1 Gfo/Idh/MocA family oxidoreductase [Kitasatospora sp. NBC_01287]